MFAVLVCCKFERHVRFHSCESAMCVKASNLVTAQPFQLFLHVTASHALSDSTLPNTLLQHTLHCNPDTPCLSQCMRWPAAAAAAAAAAGLGMAEAASGRAVQCSNRRQARYSLPAAGMACSTAAAAAAAVHTEPGFTAAM
jgi:hypothetical protein